MGLCITCRQPYHPHYIIQINDETGEKQCVWCYTGKDRITIEDDKGNYQIVEKNEASKTYEQYLRRLKDKQEVQNLVKSE